MTYLVLSLVAALLMYSGWSLAALTQDRHVESVLGHEFPLASCFFIRQIRWAAGALVLLGTIMCLIMNGPGLGSVLALLLAMTTAVAVAMTLTYRPNVLKRAAHILYDELA